MAKFRKVDAFLAAIRITPRITVAAKAAGINRSAHYRRLERDEAYRSAFDRAMAAGIDAVEEEGIRRAQYGVRKLVTYHGVPVMVPTDPSKPFHKKKNPLVPLYETEYSDTLLMFFLKARKPELYRDRVSAELTGKDGGPIDNRLEIVFIDSPHADPVSEDLPSAV